MLSANKVLLKSVCLWKRMQISPNIQANKLFEKWYACHGSGWQNKEMNKQYHWFIPLLLVRNKEKHKSLRLPTFYTEISQLSTQKLTFYDFFILRSIAISCLWILWMVALRYLRSSIAEDRISIHWKISFWHGYHQHTKWYRQAGNTGKTGPTVYPKKYAHGFVVLCFVVVMQSFMMNSHEVFIHIHQGYFAGTGAIVRLPQCQWSKPDGYGKISQCITTTKHSKAKTVCIFLGIYCNTMKPEQSNMRFADNVLQTMYLTKILLMVFPRSSIDDRLSLVQVMAGWRTNDGIIHQRMDVPMIFSCYYWWKEEKRLTHWGRLTHTCR